MIALLCSISRIITIAMFNNITLQTFLLYAAVLTTVAADSSSLLRGSSSSSSIGDDNIDAYDILKPFLPNHDRNLIDNPSTAHQHRVLAPIGGDTTLGDVQVAYTGTKSTSSWVSIPVPYKEAQGMANTMSFLGFPAVRGETVGIHTQFYDVFVDVDSYFNPDPATQQGFAYMVGDLEDESNISPKYPAPTTFDFSPWVGDDIMRLFPTYSVYKSGQQTPLTCNPPKLTRMTNTAAHQMYQIITRCGGLVFEFYAHIYHNHPVVEWELMGIFSDYTVSDVKIDIDRIDVTFGEFFKVDDSVPLGLSSSTGTYNQADDTFTTTIVTNTYIEHGQGTPVFKGALLCLPNTATFLENIRNPAIVTSSEWNVLLSRLDGIFMAGRTNWDDSWLAFQAAIPRHAGDDSLLDWHFNDQYNMMSSPQELWEQRKLGLFYNAGSTGMQWDFGSQKGTQATHGDLRFTFTWHYHLQESMRPFHYREADGSKTTGDTQSNWVTWSQITHYHPSVSPNQLGKPAWQSIPSHNWSGKDDQHKSSNALNAAVATMDWPAMRSILQDEINVALVNVRFLPNQDTGAPRAIGRRMLADANAYLLTGDEEVWTGLVLWHATNALVKSHVHETDPNSFNYMRVSEVHYGDKPPFLCAQTTNCVQHVHAPLPKIIAWQHGLLLKGVVAAWNVHLYRQSLGLPTLPGTDDLETFLVEVSSTIVRHFYAQVNGNWQTWNYIAWNNGHPIPTSILNATTPTAGHTHDRITVNNGWWHWHFAPLYYLARANHGLNLPSDVVFCLDSMAIETEAVLATADFTRREWYPWTDVV